MILTVTLNPAIDRIIILKDFSIHKLHRLQPDEMSMTVPGGKGVNISLTLNLLGNDVIATGFAGGHSGHMLCDALRKKGITTSFIFTEGVTRTNISILDTGNETLTEINDAGQQVTNDDITTFLDNYSRLLYRARFVVIAGSLAKNMSHEIMARLIRMARGQGLKVLVHASPKYLDAINNTSPFLFNPDMRSHHHFYNKPLDGIDKFIQAGKDFLIKNRDTEFVIFTHRIENVVAITRDKSFILRPRNLKIINMLGYADSFLAGFVHSYLEEKPIPDVLKFASASALSNVEVLYKEIIDIKNIEENLHRIDLETI